MAASFYVCDRKRGDIKQVNYGSEKPLVFFKTLLLNYKPTTNSSHKGDMWCDWARLEQNNPYEPLWFNPFLWKFSAISCGTNSGGTRISVAAGGGIQSQ